MPEKTSEEYQKGIWSERISSANRYYERWEDRYQCKMLERYYEGYQHPEIGTGREQLDAYTLNLICSTIEIKLASFSFQNIQFNLTPRPSRADFNFEVAAGSAQLKQDCLNTLVSNPNGLFCEEVEAALKDAFFRFAVLEVGYSADWITNPNAGKPLYLTDIDSSAGSSEEPTVIKEPDQIPQNELIYFKRIPAARFRVGGIEGRHLHQCNWFGYYDFYYADDIKSSPVLRNTNLIQTPSHRSSEWEYSPEFDELLKQGDLLKIWRLWNTRSKTVVLWDEANDVVLYEKPYSRIPIFDLRWLKSHMGWYPIPPVFHWMSPQNEINEAREQMRSYRRRFKSQQYAIEGQVDQEEIDKYEEGRDGAVIKIKRENAIGPIQNSNLTGTVPQAMVVSKDDFIAMSGTSSESMGQGDRITATQSIEISRRFGVREARDKIRVANWVERIGREALILAQEKMISGLWVQTTQDPGESIMGEVQLNNKIWEYVMTQDLQDGIDFDVVIQLTSMSPLDNDEQKTKFIEFVALMKRFPELAMSPMLIRETAYRVGYRNEAVIREMQATSLLGSLGLMAQGQGAAQAMNGGAGNGPTGDQTAQQIVAQQTPPNAEEVQNQLDKQVLQ